MVYDISKMRKMIRRHICKIIFRKKDGSKRKMFCTANWDWLQRNDVRDEVGFYSPKKGGKVWKDNLMAVFDLDKQDWRSVYLDTIEDISIEVNLDVD